MKTGFITGKDLTRRRGWSSHTIQQFLGEPDKREVKRFPNKTFTITLFSVERVEQAEENPEWQALAEGQYFVRRRAERTETRANAMDRVRNFDVKVRNTELPRDFLVRAAVDNYNERKTMLRQRQGKTPHIPVDAITGDPATITRLTLNYLRHNLTNYDWAIKKLAVADGTPEEYLTLRSRFFDALRHHFPDFAELLTEQEHRDSAHDVELYRKTVPKA